MTPTTILHEAEIELWEAVAYYESKAKGLGLDFLAEIAESVYAIAEAPDRWPLLSDGTRRRLTHRFPYLVVYVRLPDHIYICSSGSDLRKQPIAKYIRTIRWWKYGLSGDFGVAVSSISHHSPDHCRFFMTGPCWHLTHRCHNREFLRSAGGHDGTPSVEAGDRR